MPRHIVSLNGPDWRLGQAPVDADPARAAWGELERAVDWLPAQVPGNVRADLMRAGRLPDVTIGQQNEQAQWVDDRCWWLVRDLDAELSPGQRAHLVLRGVDYIAEVFLNGHALARHEGMFSPQVYDVTRLLAGRNRLAVRLLGSRWLPRNRSSRWEKLLNRVEAAGLGVAGRFPDRRDTLKCQMGFGWDFAPPLRTMGIWDDACLLITDAIVIREVAARPRVEPGRTGVQVSVDLDAVRPRPVRLRAILAPDTFEGEPIVVERPAELPAGQSRHSMEIRVPEPRLWWPWDHGTPDLYRLTVEVLAAGAEGDARDAPVLDGTTERIGLRRIEMEGWTLKVNGRAVFARGANWVPADVLPGRVTRDDYAALLELARHANMNMLRVWGGGLREKRAFYDLCDQMGLLLWQEFPLACAFITRYPRSPEFLRLAEDEARAIVHDVRNHPSVALWSGGNEFSPRRNAALVAALARAAAEDPGRPFLPASPHAGDSHNWKVWHGFEPPAAYREDRPGFASEFGLQAPPDAAALRRFLPQDAVWPPGPSWTYHGAGLRKLWRYARPFLAGPRPDLEAFVRASQAAQAHGVKIAVEHYRRMKAEGCRGVLVWQLNEPWPAISWAIVDFFRQPKPAYDTLRRSFSPVLVSVEYELKRYQAGDRLCPAAWIINDSAEALPGCRLEVVLSDGAGRRLHVLSRTLDVMGDSAVVAGRACWTLPEGDGWRLICELSRDGQILAANEYDLTVHDGLGPTPWQRLRRRLSDVLMPK